MDNATCTPVDMPDSVLPALSHPDETTTDNKQDRFATSQLLVWNSAMQPSVRPFNCGGGSFSELLMNASTGMMYFDDEEGPGSMLGALGRDVQNADSQNQCDVHIDVENADSQNQCPGSILGALGRDASTGIMHFDDDDGYLGADDSDDGPSDDDGCALLCDETSESDSTDIDDISYTEKTSSAMAEDCEQEVTVDEGDEVTAGDQILLSESSDSEEEITVEVDLAQEFYSNKDQEGVPYKKRKRFPKGFKRPNFRTPRAMGAVERALRNATKHNAGRVFEPKLGMVFDSPNEAKEFYNMYGWEMGFGVKFNCSRPTGGRKVADDGSENYISMQEIVCQRSGHDSRITTGTKRCGCPAKIRLLRTEDYGWYISAFVKDHNHEFSRTMGDKREWTSHREIEPCMREMIKNLRHNNVPLTRVHCILGDIYGSKGDVPWTKRSLRTICNQISKDQMNDDIKKTMEIFRDMHDSDPGFQFSVELDKQSRIKTILWCSGRSRDQYACFGDVVTFDTTYCTNIYRMPFGLFVGVNHHFQTTIFAGVLMRRETARSFSWVFNEFLKLMGGKAPVTVLTDQCKAMAKALRIVMPNTYHLWCKWHVMKKIRESLGPLYTKNKKFREEYWLVVNAMLTEDEFEAAWADLVKRYHLESNGFMNRIYKSKKKWAKPWSKDKFCARMSSTQRSESANCMLKRFVPRNSSLNHFVSQFSRMLHDREREEDIAEHKTKQLRMVHSRLWSIERHALSIYTKAAFELFRSEVDKASNYKYEEIESNTYMVTHDNAEKRAQWARVHFKVSVIDGGKKYVCECGLYEHFGMLCCHIIRLLLNDRIPEAHIMKRWTRDARDVLPAGLKSYQKDQSSMQSNTFRNRLLHLQSVKLQSKGDSDVELFDVVMKHMKAAEKEADEIIARRLQNQDPQPDDESTGEENDIQSDGGILRNTRNAAPKAGSRLMSNNRYGASGSSAHYSDTEIVGMRAPYFKRPASRPRNNRFYAGSEYRKKRWQKKGKKGSDCFNLEGQEDTQQRDGVQGSQPKKGSKREVKCGKCGLKGHNSTQCCSLPITDQTAAAYL